MDVEIIRSDKRAKTISGRLVDGKIVIRAPSSMSDQELKPHVENLRRRLEKRLAGRDLDDQSLEQLARELNKRYFRGQLRWKSIRWVTNQDKRFGSCTPTQGTIRISHRIAKMPRFVLEYIVVHELAHLVEANHGKRFWKLVNQYPRTERARGYLMAVGMEELSE